MFWGFFFNLMTHPHLVLLQPESVGVDGWWWQLSDEGFSLPQPRLQFLIRLPEPSHQNLGLLQRREALTVPLADCIVASAERICLHLRDRSFMVCRNGFLEINCHFLIQQTLSAFISRDTHDESVFLGIAASFQDVVSGS